MTYCSTWVLALNDDLSVTSIEIHFSDFRFLWNKCFNNLFCIINIHNCVNWRTKYNLSFDSLGNLSNKAVSSSEFVHFGGDDGDVARFKVHGVVDCFWNNLSNFIFQFFVGHLHSIYLNPALSHDL